MFRRLPLLVCCLTLLAACSGGGGGGGGGGPAPADTGVLPRSVSLLSAVPGNGNILLRFDATDATGAAVAIGIFQSTSAATLGQGAVITSSTGPGTFLVNGLTNGTTYHFRLGIAGGPNHVPSGAALSAVPRAPIHVDAASIAVAPDGSSPASAFPTLAAAVARATVLGGGNVWIAEGTYDVAGLQLTEDHALYGGFGVDFSLATHDPALHVALVRGGAAASIFELVGGGGTVVIDGLEIDARSLSAFAIDIDSTDAQLRALEIRTTTSHALRLRSTNTIGSVEVGLAGCWVHDAGGEGVSLDGTFELELDASRFSANRREGVSLGLLRAPNGVPASLSVRSCTFSGNGEDGLDCQLAPPLVAGGSSSYAVLVEDSLFELNGFDAGGLPTAGLRVDLDFELVAGWSADVLVRGSTARANRGDGFTLDLDAASSVCLHRVLASGNAGDGLEVSSESATGLALVTNSAFTNNLGLGVRALLGNVPVAASQCVIAGNAGGGFTSSAVTSTAAASIAWLQPSAFSGVQQHFVTASNDDSVPMFANAPVEFARVSAFAAGSVTLSAASSLALGDTVELGDDGVARTLDALGGPNQFHVDPAPLELAVPTGLARFGGASVDEDLGPGPGSPALAAGMPAPAGPTPDAGSAGGPLAGAPGTEELPLPGLFRPSGSTPASTTSLGQNTSVVFGFRGGTLSAASIAGQVRARDAVGNLLTISTSAAGGNLTVQPPAGGWPSGTIVIELHTGLSASSGTTLCAPVAVRYLRP